MRGGVIEVDKTTNKIICLINNHKSQSHFHQIKAQIILNHLHSHTTIAQHLITKSLNLHSLLPLFFTHLTKPHVFTCNTLLKAFSHSQIPHIPYFIYTFMLKINVVSNNYTYPFLFKSLSDFKDYRRGQTVHTHVVKLGFLNDIYVENSLLGLYVSCGRMSLFRKVFDEMSHRDVVSWTVLIMGYKNLGRFVDALVAFELMQYANVVPNRVTMVNALGACSSCGAIDMGIWIHDFITRRGWELDVILGTALMDMYLKCGRIKEGLSVFRSMDDKNIFTWNSAIKGLAFAKCGKEAIQWFDRMQEEGVWVDEITLVNVLSACSHSGLVNDGKQIFGSIVIGHYGFSPNVKHYACMIDLLTRSGFLDEALKVTKQMPFEPTKSIWGSLLAGGRAEGNLELSEFVARKLLELEPANGAYYVLLSNLYAEMGRWNDVAKVRELMKEKGIKKESGCSSIEFEV